MRALHSRFGGFSNGTLDAKPKTNRERHTDRTLRKPVQMHWLHQGHRSRPRSLKEMERIDMVARSEIDVLTPRTLDEALHMLHETETGLKIVAGASDVIVQLRDGAIKPNKLLNILSLTELRFIRLTSGQVHIGALSTYSDIVHNEITQKHGWVLVEAAK